MNSLSNCTRVLCRFQSLSLTNHMQQRYAKRYVKAVLAKISTIKRDLYKMDTEPKPPNPRSSYLEWNRDAELFAFNNRLSEKFHADLLQQALTHRSYVIQEEEAQKKVGIEDPCLEIADNRELIEEGQEIANIIIDNYLGQALPLAPQEVIYTLRNYLLETENFAKISSSIGTTDLILTSEHPPSEETIANTLYALISALKHSVDLEHAGIFVRDIIIATLADKDLTEIWCPDNPLEILNDILYKENRELAEARVIYQAGVNSLLPVYQIALYSNKEYLGSGTGETPEEGTKVAALNILMKMFGLLDSSKPLRFNLKVKENTELNNLSLDEWCSNKL